MLWFKKKKEKIKEQHDLERAVEIQVQTHKDATKESVEEANRVADKFNKVINENGFTLVIQVAATRKK